MGLSFAAFGRIVGVSRQAIARGARAGRLNRSLGVDTRGRACVADAGLARREWAAGATKPANPGRRRSVDADRLALAALELVIIEFASEHQAPTGREAGDLLFDAPRLLAWLEARGYQGRY